MKLTMVACYAAPYWPRRARTGTGCLSARPFSVTAKPTKCCETMQHTPIVFSEETPLGQPLSL